MAIATINRSSIIAAPSINQQMLCEGLKVSLISSGLTFHHEYTSGTTKFIVFTNTVGSGTYATSYYRVQVTSALVVSHQLFTAFNTTTNTGSFGSGETHSVTFLSSSDIALVALNGNNNCTEFGLVGVLQGSVFQLLGILSCENSFDIWTRNRAPKDCISQTSTGSAWSLCGVNIFNNVNLTPDSVGSSLISTFSTEYNTFVLEKGIKLRSNTGQGAWLWTSENIAVAPGNSIPRLTVFAEPGSGKNFIMLGTGNGALCIEVSNA